MKQIRYPDITPPARYTTKYDNFRGVDMSTDPTQIDNRRSPWAPNLISDAGGFPEKRPGWRTIAEITGKRINGIWHGLVDGENVEIVHAGDGIYRWVEDTGETELLKGGVLDAAGSAFLFGGKMWILTGREYLVCGKYPNPDYDISDPESVENTIQVKTVTDTAYSPTTVIARKPSGGGTPYEDVNLLSPKRTNLFLADGSAKVYQLDASGLDADVVTATVDGAEKTEGTDFTVDRDTGKVTFTTAPEAPSVAGQDNVSITFCKTVAGYADRIGKCRFAALYGVGSNDRIFFSGNPEYPAYDWHCGLGDPSYVPDLSYAVVGTDGNAIMGYRKLGEYLMILKEDNLQDSTIYLRHAETSENGTALFPLKQGVTGVGAAAVRCIGNLKDEPLFLARTGIYAISTNAVTYERTVQNRSYFIDAALTREEGLENAVGVEWNGYYIAAVNGRAYILDGLQEKSYKSKSYGDFVYECYHWDNIPARCFMERAGDLYFGTEDGRICRFNTDRSGMDRYSDDGEPVVARWSTKADDDGDFMRKKTIPKRGTGILLKPYTRSGAKVIIRTEKDFGTLAKDVDMDIFTFEDIDFGRFTFNTNDSPQAVPINKKVKKYITCQIIVENDAVNEGFGVYGIIKRYTMGSYVKR